MSANGAAFAGKVVLITGASGGQGVVHTRHFEQRGATVIGTDVTPGAGVVEHDVRSESAWAGVIAHVERDHGRLDVLVNNAGVLVVGPLLDTSPDDYRRVVDVNQTGTFLGMRAAAPLIAASGGGAIVNVSSIAGLWGAPAMVAYASSKWAIRGMTKVAARELAPLGIRVNSVHPGLVDTAMLDTVRGAGEGVLDGIVGSIPLGRMATSDDVAEVVVWLASDAARYVTGAEVAVDGAMTA